MVEHAPTAWSIVLIFIENTPRAYAWGSTDALPAMLGHEPTGEPQAELWLGDHPGSPASIAKATPVPHTLIELIANDPEHYGVDGGSLPFLLKVLAIGAPLSLQAHPDPEQARAGFAAENAAGVPIDAPHRNYRDANHKPELLVALGETRALSGFRPLEAAAADLRALAAAAPDGSPALLAVARRLSTRMAAEAVRQGFLGWAFSDSPEVAAALEELAAVVGGVDPALEIAVDPDRLACLRDLISHYPGDPGVLVSLLLHHVVLAPGEAIYLGARQLHAYLNGIAVEVMATSDNVLRAGLTSKHIDVPELLSVIDYAEIVEPRFPATRLGDGFKAWQPSIPDFKLFRARVSSDGKADCSTEAILIDAAKPLVLIVTEGRVLVSRPDAELSEMANVARGQSLYVSAGEPIHLTGNGEAFLATVGH